MKNTRIGISLAIVIVLALAVTGFALAQDDTPERPEWPNSSGMMPGYGSGFGMQGGFGGHGMWGSSGDYGPMHETMLGTLAEQLGLSVEDLEARHEAGETMWDIAAEAGLSSEDIQSLMLEARGAALEQMVADGLISPEQAQWMQARMGAMRSGEYGLGGCHGYEAGAGWRGRGMHGGRGGWNRWNFGG